MSHWEEDISTAVTEDVLNVAVSAMSRASDTVSSYRCFSLCAFF